MIMLVDVWEVNQKQHVTKRVIKYHWIVWNNVHVTINVKLVKLVKMILDNLSALKRLLISKNV